MAEFVGISIVLIIAFMVSAHWPYRYRIIKPMLEQVLGGQVTIAHYRRTYFPNPGFMASGIALDRNPTPGVPPLGTVSSIFVQGNWLDFTDGSRAGAASRRHWLTRRHSSGG